MSPNQENMLGAEKHRGLTLADPFSFQRWICTNIWQPGSGWAIFRPHASGQIVSASGCNYLLRKIVPVRAKICNFQSIGLIKSPMVGSEKSRSKPDKPLNHCRVRRMLGSGHSPFLFPTKSNMGSSSRKP